MGFYKCAVGVWGVAPSEFWQMTPQEWWWLHAVKMANAQAFTHKDLQDLDDFAAEHGEKYRGKLNGK